MLLLNAMDQEWEITRAQQEEEELEEEDLQEQQLVALAVLMLVGAEESHRLRAER